MIDFPILSTVTFLPTALAALILLFVHGKDEWTTKVSQQIALWGSVGVFLLSLILLRDFDPSVTGFQFVEKHVWMAKWGISYHKGIDGLSIWFVLISTFLTPFCVLCTFKSITTRVKEFMIALLVLETMMIGMFTALDLVLFYLFFEGVLIPMFLIVGVWGGKNRVYAAYKFFLYTFVGSVLMLLALMAMAFLTGTTDMVTIITSTKFPFELSKWLWAACFLSFAVKTPMWPFHTWLPYAHVEAPTAGSVILAGVLLKMGGYGLIRMNMQMFPEASAHFAPLVLWLSVIAIIYTSLVALAQTDIKKLIAYSSVAHMGYVTLGVFSFNTQGMDGAMFVMLSHTVVASALFLCVGVVYDRLHTREIAAYGGLASTMPYYAIAFMVFTLASIGLPGTSGFIGELLSMVGAFQASSWVALCAALGVILGAAYMLWLYRRMFYGEAASAEAASMPDLSFREVVIFIPLILLVFWMGIHPATFQRVMEPTLRNIQQEYHKAISKEAA